MDRRATSPHPDVIHDAQTAASEDMEIAKALLQLSYEVLLFACYLLFLVFVAPFSFGLAAFVSAWNSLRGQNYVSATTAVSIGILMEIFGFGLWIVVASWIFGSPVQYR